MCALVKGYTDILTPPNILLDTTFARWSNQKSTYTFTDLPSTHQLIYEDYYISRPDTGSTRFSNVTVSVVNRRLRITGTLSAKDSEPTRLFLRIHFNVRPTVGSTVSLSCKCNDISGHIAYVYLTTGNGYTEVYNRYENGKFNNVRTYTSMGTDIGFNIFLNNSSINVGDTFTFEFYEPTMVYGSFCDLEYKPSLDISLGYWYNHRDTVKKIQSLLSLQLTPSSWNRICYLGYKHKTANEKVGGSYFKLLFGKNYHNNAPTIMTIEIGLYRPYNSTTTASAKITRTLGSSSYLNTFRITELESGNYYHYFLELNYTYSASGEIIYITPLQVVFNVMEGTANEETVMMTSERINEFASVAYKRVVLDNITPIVLGS